MDGRVFENFHFCMPEEDSEFEEFMRKRKGRGDGENAFKHRFLHQGYTKMAFSNEKVVPQEVVIKIICRGHSTGHLSTLIKYIGRELDYQEKEGQEKAVIYDACGHEVAPDEFSDLIEKWSDDFKSVNSDLDSTTLEGIDEVNRIYSSLHDKRYEQKLSHGEQIIYDYSRKFLDKKFPDKNKTELKEGDFVFYKPQSAFLFVAGALDRDTFSVASIKRDGDIFQTEAKRSELDNVTYEVQKHHRTIPKNFTHMILSPGGDNPNKKGVIKATEAYLKKELAARGYEYVWALHDDTKHLHCHVVVKNKSFLREQGWFVLNKFDLQSMRLAFARDLDGYGIDRRATLKYDRAAYLEKLKARAENIRRTDRNWWEYKLSESDNKNFDALKFRKNAIRNFDFLSEKLDRMGERKAAKILRKERDGFLKLEPDEVDRAINATATKLKNERKDLGEFFKHEFIKKMGEAGQYQKDQQEKIVHQVSKEFLNHISTTQQEIDSMSEKHMNAEMLDRKLNVTLQLAEMEAELKKIRGMDIGMGM